MYLTNFSISHNMNPILPHVHEIYVDINLNGYPNTLLCIISLNVIFSLKSRHACFCCEKAIIPSIS
jgi:hypothetical protein